MIRKGFERQVKHCKMLRNSAEEIMKKKVILLMAICLFVLSVIFLLIGLWEDNNTARIVGFILLAISNLLNIARGFSRWNDGK
jgi:uncharacterized membrane protein YiaA